MEQLPTVVISGPHQTRTSDWSDAVCALGDALETVLAGGVHDLPGIVSGLNALGSTDARGTAWTEAELRSRLARLGR